jgi:hypothetical protein
MELVQGTRLTLDQVNERYVQQAIEFYLRANQQLDDPATRALLPASESCFSIDEHLMKTEIRVNRLREGIQIADDVDREAQELIMEKLLPIWYKTLQKIGGSLDKSETSEVLPLKERCLSPSDFGFHNALLQNDGTLRFLDFEFAGWDDPAKLIIDFANQPDMLLESRLSNLFREAVIHHHIAPKKLEKRVHLLEPIYQIKWACICMNCFLAFGRKRLQFTGGLEDELIMKRRQLAKARIMLARGSPI